MGKITDVFYTEIPEEKCDINRAGEYYFNHNFVNIDQNFIPGYLLYEESQANLRNDIIFEGVKSGEISRSPKMDSIIMGISSIKNKVVLAVEY